MPWGGTEQHSRPETRSENGRISIGTRRRTESDDLRVVSNFPFGKALVLLKKLETDPCIKPQATQDVHPGDYLQLL